MAHGKIIFLSIRTYKKRAKRLHSRLGKLSLEKNDQRKCTRFLAKYGGLYIQDIDFEKRYSIYDEDIHFVKGNEYSLIVNPYNPDVTLTDNEYFFIHYDLFKRILETDQNSDIILKQIHKDQ